MYSSAANGPRLPLQFGRLGAPLETLEVRARREEPTLVHPCRSESVVALVADRPGRGISEQSTGTRVLVVDDDPQVRRLFGRLLTDEGYLVDAVSDGLSAQLAVESRPPDLVLLDAVMPGLGGFDVCRRFKQDPATALLPVILVTALSDRDSRVEGLAAGADDFLTKPVDRDELLVRVRSLARIKRYTDDLDSATAIIMTLAAMIESRDGYTEGHCHRMANYATALGRRLGLGEDALQALHRGGFLHDIGMLAVPDAVLSKRGALSCGEYDLVKSHPVVGDSLLANFRSFQAVRPIVRHHHERLDGSGYPDGLHGDQIPLMAQIVGLVDVFDALVTPRPYQAAMSIDRAEDVLRSHARVGWRSPDLVDAFIAIVESRRQDSCHAPVDAERTVTDRSA